MKKILSILSIVFCTVCLITSTGLAGPAHDAPGFYKHSVTGAVKYFKNGHPGEPSQWTPFEMDCDDCVPTATAEAHPNIEISGSWVTAPGSTDWAGGQATSSMTMSGDAYANGMDYIEESCEWVPGYWTGKPWRSKYVWGHFETIETFIAGFAEASGFNNEPAVSMSSDVDINTNGPQVNGLSFTTVTATSTVALDASVWAKGTKGCPQTAFIEVEGSLGAFAYGNSFSGVPLGSEGQVNGPYAKAGGSGKTTVSFAGTESDYSTNGMAYVDFDSTITVEHSLVSKSFVSEDGTTSWNFAKTAGGSAELTRGNDGFLGMGKDNIDLTGIAAEGSVFQSGMAAGSNSFAFGSSSASFTGANGSVASIPGRDIFCVTLPSPGMTANVGGHAVVKGYNNITTNPGTLSVTSNQYAYATTGNTSPANNAGPQ